MQWNAPGLFDPHVRGKDHEDQRGVAVTVPYRREPELCRRSGAPTGFDLEKLVCDLHVPSSLREAAALAPVAPSDDLLGDVCDRVVVRTHDASGAQHLDAADPDVQEFAVAQRL